MFEYTQADIQAQVAALPLGFRVWFQWMFVVIVLAPICFVRHPQGRIAVLFSLVFLALQLPLLHIVGLTNLLSLTHLVVWGPLVVYLCRELRSRRILLPSVFGGWAILAVSTCIISIVFDVRDFGRWIAGARGVVHPPAAPGIPWLWVDLIIGSLIGLGWYIRGEAPGKASNGRSNTDDCRHGVD